MVSVRRFRLSAVKRSRPCDVGEVMIKIVAVIKKKPTLSRDEFIRYWHDDHPFFVRALPGIRGYRQNPAIDHRKEWPFDGMAELWFDDVSAVKEAYSGDEAAALFAHEEEFLESTQWFISEEAPVFGVTE